MPFTPAHSAIVLPFIRINPRYVSATGLIAGSIAPDFEYFFKMSVSGVHGHTLLGLFYFDLPVSIAIAFVFHVVVKRNLIDNLPVILQSRFRHVYNLDFLNYFRRHYVAFIMSALIGALSHIFWDNFTHATGWFVNTLPFYEGAYLPFDGVNYPLWYALQHISTAVGLAFIFIYVAFMRADEKMVVKPSFTYWLFVLTIIVIVIFMRFNFNPMQADLGNFVVSTVSASCLAVFAAGMLPIRKRIHG
jgi:hypothetical protein